MNDENRNLTLPQNDNLMTNMFASKERFELAQRISRMFASSEMVPKNYRGDDNIANCMIALDMAGRLNANPLMVMQNLQVVEGRPSWSSKFLISTVNAHPGFGAMHYVLEHSDKPQNVEWTDYVWNDNARRKVPVEKIAKGIMNTSCYAWAIDRETGENLIGPTVDIVMAIKERWYYRRNSKWQTMEDLMLRYRAASMWVSLFAPQLSMGIPTEEEARDIIDVTPSVVVEPTKQARTGEKSIDTLNAAARQKQKEAAPPCENGQQEEVVEPAEPTGPAETTEPEDKAPTQKPEPDEGNVWPKADPGTGELVDSRGIPYNEDYYSGAKTCSAHTGHWRVRKGADRRAMMAWENQIIAQRAEERAGKKVKTRVRSRGKYGQVLEKQKRDVEQEATKEIEKPEQEQVQEEPATLTGLNISPEFFYNELKAINDLDQVDGLEDLLSNPEVQEELGEEHVTKISSLIAALREGLEATLRG